MPHARAACARTLFSVSAAPAGDGGTDPIWVYPKSVIRVQSNFVLLPCRLAATFAEGVAGYAETKA